MVWGGPYATGLAEAGARVICADVAEDAAQQLAATLSAAGHTASAVRADVVREDDARAMVERAGRHLWQARCRFCNAGIGGAGAPLQT